MKAIAVLQLDTKCEYKVKMASRAVRHVALGHKRTLLLVLAIRL